VGYLQKSHLELDLHHRPHNIQTGIQYLLDVSHLRRCLQFILLTISAARSICSGVAILRGRSLVNNDGI
jgi:hypothetical protein